MSSSSLSNVNVNTNTSTNDSRKNSDVKESGTVKTRDYIFQQPDFYIFEEKPYTEINTKVIVNKIS